MAKKATACRKSANFYLMGFSSLMFQVSLPFSLLPTGTTVSLETTNSLLDLLCYYGDQEPSAYYNFQQKEKSEELVMAFGNNFLSLFW